MEIPRAVLLGAARWLGWLGKGFWAVLDQALFAGTNFLVNVLLARWLEPAGYGAFSLAFSVFLLLGTAHTALWTEPMLVYGSGRFRASFLAYQRILIGYHWRFGAISSVAFVLVAVGFEIWGQRELALSFLGLALAAPMVLYLWLVRRGAYVLLEPRLAVYGGASYLALYLGVAWLLFKASLLNEVTAFLGMAIASLFAAGVIRFVLKAGSWHPVEPSQVRALHWDYGRWSLLAGTLSWVPGNIYFVALSAFHGLEAVAQLKALMNLIMPVLQFYSATASILLPAMARLRASGKKVAGVRGIALAGLFMLSSLYWIVLALWGEDLWVLLYKDRFLEARVWMPWLGLLAVVAGGISVMEASLRASEQPQRVMLAYSLYASFALTMGVILTRAYGLGGAVGGMLMGKVLGGLVLWLMSRNA